MRMVSTTETCNMCWRD